MSSHTRAARRAVAVALAVPAGLGAPAVSTPPRAGDPAPPLTLEGILPSEVSTVQTARELGRNAAVVEFWATWCGPCVKEIAHLNELATALKDEPIRFLSVTDEDEAVIRAFLGRREIEGWIGLDPDRSMFDTYGVTAVPMTFLVDRDGVVRAVTHPSLLSEKVLRDLVAGRTAGLQTRLTPRAVVPVVALAGGRPEPLFLIDIRPTTSSEPSLLVRSKQGTLEARAIEAVEALRLAFDVPDSRLALETPLPDDRYDLDVNVGSRVDLLRPLLQQALPSALRLDAVREPREADVHVLERRAERAGLRPSAQAKRRVRMADGSIRGEAVPMPDLAELLERSLGHPVVDETRLEGRFDFVLTWDPRQAGALRGALEQRLGLELRPAVRSIEMVVVRGLPSPADR